MQLTMGKHEMELGGPLLGYLRDSNALMGDPAALQERMAEDGYLMIRQLHDPVKVQAARTMLLENLAANGQIDTTFPLDRAKIAEGARGAFLGGSKAITHTPEFLGVVESPELLKFFADFLRGPSLTFDFKWTRVMGTGDFSGAHYDMVYMGRGTKNLFTCWTPFGDVNYKQSPLIVLSGSHKHENLKSTYGKMDVDKHNVTGAFSNDPIALIDQFGGQWLTTEFKAGDAIIFGMYTMHASLNNTTDCFRLSADTRYQRADEPADERWMGANPIGHYAWNKGETVSMEDARKRWGV